MPWSQDALTSQHRCGTKCMEFFEAGTHAQASVSRDYVGASLQRHGYLIQCHMVIELKDSRLTDRTRTNLYLNSHHWSLQHGQPLLRCGQLSGDVSWYIWNRWFLGEMSPHVLWKKIPSQTSNQISVFNANFSACLWIQHGIISRECYMKCWILRCYMWRIRTLSVRQRMPCWRKEQKAWLYDCVGSFIHLLKIEGCSQQWRTESCVCAQGRSLCSALLI